MPGAWEIPERVLVAILTGREMVSTAWAFGFRNLIIPNGSYTGLSGMPFDDARNTACTKLLELDWEWLFFLDDDVIPPADTIPRLMKHRKPIVSGLYYRRNDPIVPCMLRGKQWITEFHWPDLLEVDFVGAGCLLIHRDVLLSLPPISKRCHWFAWRVGRNDLPEDDRLSEDFSFCRHARSNGYKVLVDTSVHCRHGGLSESRLPGEIKPLELRA